MRYDGTPLALTGPEPQAHGPHLARHRPPELPALLPEGDLRVPGLGGKNPAEPLEDPGRRPCAGASPHWTSE